ncbi:MAG: family N-acetyltransferase [Aeromicrobium sp.]|nr:family N-acetyltransferase [Aeromicrobium sp.]
MLTRQINEAELRALEPWRAAEFAIYTAQNRSDLAPWLPWAASIVDEQTAREFLQRYADATARDGGRIFGLWLDDELVGGTLFRVFEPGQSLCEIGVWLSVDHQGRGLVTDAVRTMIDWAVRERGIRRVEWHCVPNNEPSRKLAARLGFQLDGVLRQAFEYDDRVHDIEVWSLLADDWARAAQE